MTDNRLPSNLGSECASTAHSIEFVATSRLKRERSTEVVQSLLRKVDVLLDTKVSDIQKGLPSVACRKGCDHCCHRVVFSSVLEVLDAAVYIERTFTADQRVDLNRKLSDHLATVGLKMGHDLDKLRVTCPMLDNGRCSIYEVRPIVCRAQFSVDLESCLESESDTTQPFFAAETEAMLGRAAQSGLGTGLKASELWPHPVDFPRAVRMALKDTSLSALYLSGQPVFELAAPVFDQQVPPLSPATNSTNYRKGEEPTGTVNSAVLDLPYYYLQTTGEAEKAFARYPNEGPLHQVFRMQVPMAYRKTEEIGLWRSRMTQAFEEFASSRSDPREKFDALTVYYPNSLSYQQQDDRELLSRIGDYLSLDLSARIFPDLCTPILKRKREGKLRVGYIGVGLSQSSGSFWASGWLKNHSSEVDTYSFYLNSSRAPGAEVFEQHSDHYYHCPGPVGPTARLIKEQNLDVLIYPDPTSVGRDIQFASLRLAPVQCAGWGAPETTGLPNMDYFLSSDWMEPIGAESHYREELVRLPGTGVCYPTLSQTGRGWTKADFGLDDGPLFLCIQAPSKLLPEWDGMFKEICDRTGRPIVFFSYPFTAASLTESRLKAAGVNALFMPCLNSIQFHDLLGLADVSLDSVGWSGGITAILALQQTRPVITLPGEFRRGRHSMAFLKAANAPDLIATSRDDYVDLVCNANRRDSASRTMTPEALFNDLQSVHALEQFLFSVAWD